MKNKKHDLGIPNIITCYVNVAIAVKNKFKIFIFYALRGFVYFRKLISFLYFNFLPINKTHSEFIKRAKEKGYKPKYIWWKGKPEIMFEIKDEDWEYIKSIPLVQ